MTQKPDWLPDLISVDGIWEEVLTLLYKIFRNDFMEGKPYLGSLPVWWDSRILSGEKYVEGFWHLISRNDKITKERLLDPRRAERLPWCRPTIQNKNSHEVRIFDFKEVKGKIRTYLWLEQWDYVVILEKRKQKVGTVAFLITAFYVDGNSRKANLMAKYLKRIA